MLRTLFAAIVVAVSISAAVSAADYDLATYLSKVEAGNTVVALARRDLDSAAQSVVQARSALLPTVALQGSYKRNLLDLEQSTAVAASATAVNGVYPFIRKDVDTNFDNELMLALGVNQKIFDAEALARYQQAKTGRTLRSQALETTRWAVRASAKKLYAQTQLAVSVVSVMESSERTAEETYRNIERKFKVGLAKELDMLMAEVDWKSRVPKTADARKNAEISLNAFKNLAGIALSEPVVLTESLAAVPDLPAAPKLDAVLSSRPDYAIEVLSGDLADIARKAAFGSFLPTIGASFSYARGGYYGHISASDKYEFDTMQLGATVTLPLFTGGYRLSLMETAKIEQEKQSLKLSQKRRDIEQDLTSVRLRLETARGGIDSARLVVETAQRAAVLSKAAFDNGLATQLSVSQASTNFDQARLGLLNAQYEYRAAYYDWELATGASD